jgi:UDP-glucose 4-epimerase
LQNHNVFISGSNGWIGKSFQKTLKMNNRSTEAINRVDLVKFTARIKALSSAFESSTVIHCAGLAHQHASTSEQLLFEANAELPTKLATIARDAGSNTFVLISSAKVMGDISKKAFVETDSCHPIGAYAQSKLAGELQVESVLKNSGTRLIIVRPPLVYGPEVKANFHSLMRLADSGLPLPLLGANQPRSMIYLENLTSMVLDLINLPEAQGCFLLSDQESLSTCEWVRRLRIQFGKPARLFSGPYGIIKSAARLSNQSDKFDRLFEPFVLNTQKVTQLGITPKFRIAQSIQLTAEWFKVNQNKRRLQTER